MSAPPPRHFGVLSMTQPATISADYTLRPSELAATLALLVEARQPAMVWGAPGTAKSMIAQQVATDGGREYVDVRALLLDPVDLRGIPWRDAADRINLAPVHGEWRGQPANPDNPPALFLIGRRGQAADGGAGGTPDGADA